MSEYQFPTKVITVVMEANMLESGPSGTKCSLWITPGNVTDDRPDESPYYYEIPDSVRLVGPVDYLIASEIWRNLAAVLRKSGFEVYELETTDD